MEVITLNGKDFVKASKAAREVGYTSDYVGQLCRSKAISAERFGRSWYVDREELREHKDEKKRNSRSKAREHVQKVVEEKQQEQESQKVVATSSDEKTRYEHRYLSHGVSPSYSQDEGPLMPKVKKMAINKDYRDYVVDDAPEIIIEPTKTKEVDTLEHTRIPITVQAKVLASSPRKISSNISRLPKKSSAQSLKFTPDAIAARHEEVSRQDKKVQNPVRRGSLVQGFVAVSFALILGVSIIGAEVSLMTEETVSGDRSFVQLTQEYNLNLSAAVADILLKI